jgi:hypothetical protein
MTKLYPSNPRLLQKLNLEKKDYFKYFYDKPGNRPDIPNIEGAPNLSRIVLIDYDKIYAVRRVDVISKALISYSDSNTVS